jgi:hypothetical protein
MNPRRLGPRKRVTVGPRGAAIAAGGSFDGPQTSLPTSAALGPCGGRPETLPSCGRGILAADVAGYSLPLASPPARFAVRADVSGGIARYCGVAGYPESKPRVEVGKRVPRPAHHSLSPRRQVAECANGLRSSQCRIKRRQGGSIFSTEVDFNDRLVSEGGDQLDLLVGEGLNLELVQDDDTDDVVSSEHGYSEYRSDGINVTQSIPVLGIHLQVGYMDGPSLKCDSGRNGVASWCSGVAPCRCDRRRTRKPRP